MDPCLEEHRRHPQHLLDAAALPQLAHKVLDRLHFDPGLSLWWILHAQYMYTACSVHPQV